MKRRHFTHFNLAGFTYWEGPVVFDQLKIGTRLRLEKEDDNKYDAKAVAIYFGEHKLGFVPRASNDELSKLCEQGYADLFDVRINRIAPDHDTEDQIGIVVHLLENTNR